MLKYKTIKEVQEELKRVREKKKSIGFVPTMGALHEGHLALVREAMEDNDFVVVSIFVNPIQFNNKLDLEKYPRVIEQDIKLLEEVGCDLLFYPGVEEMYPEGEPPEEEYDVNGLDKVLEGEYRPGHFSGVITVVKRLFEIVEPDRAYFGMKDYQQLLIINTFVKNYHIPVEIVPVPTQREEDGLAMSSRNRLLKPEHRKEATLLYEVLKKTKIRSGFQTVEDVKKEVVRKFKKAKYAELEYFELVDLYTLKPLSTWVQSSHVIALIAARVGDVRLIDNMIIFM